MPREAYLITPLSRDEDGQQRRNQWMVSRLSETPAQFGLFTEINKNMLLWINDALMAVFFHTVWKLNELMRDR